MPPNSLGSNCFYVGGIDDLNSRSEHNSASLDSDNPRLASYGITSMISSTILEARRWTMPAMVQDLASLFRLEAASPDSTDASARMSFDSTQLSIVRSHSQDIQPSALFSNGRMMETNAKSRTRFILAQPPPVKRSKQRLSTRPRMVLQLQRVTDNLRPLPTFDIISSTGLASRFARSVPRMMRGEKFSSTENLVLVRSDVYGQGSAADCDKTDGSGDEATRRHRDFLGTICYARKVNDSSLSQDEICLDNGLIWKATCLKAGLYEFSGKNHDGLRLRWVLRRARGLDLKRNSLRTESSNKRYSSRFTFSIINPTTRLHPVIATLTRDNRLDILDRFPTLLSSQSASPPSSYTPSSMGSELSSDASYFERQTSGEVIYTETDEALQMLIILTAVWVMSREGSTEILSRSLDVVNKPRVENTNGSPSAPTLSTETGPQGSPPAKRIFSSCQRSSTSPSVLNRASGSQLAGSGKVGSATMPRSRIMASTVPLSNESHTLPLTAALRSCQQESEPQIPAISVEGQGQSSILIPRESSDTRAKPTDRLPLVDCGEADRDRGRVSAPSAPENPKESGRLEKHRVKESEQKGLKLRPNKLVKFRAACKSLVGPCRGAP
jgi:hypothetical protein